MKKKVINIRVFYLLFCVFIFFTISCDKKTKIVKHKKIRAVEYMVVISKKIKKSIIARGIINPNQQADLAFRISGIVEKKLSNLGKEVKEKEILATLESEDFELQLLKASENKTLSLSNLTRIKAKARPEEVNVAKAKLIAARKAYDFAEENYKRQIGLKKLNILSNLALEKLKTDFEVKEENVEIALQQLRLLNKGSRTEDISQATQQVALLNIEVKIAQQNLKYINLLAPFPGIVSLYKIDKGEFAIPGKIVVSVQDLYKVKLKISVSEKQILQIKPKQKVKIFIDALQKKPFYGYVSYAAYSSDVASRTFPVEIIMKNKDLKIRAGMFARANIFTEGVEDVMLVPPNCILKDFEGNYVYVLANNPNNLNESKVLHRRVVIGKLIGEFVTIESGLSPREGVVISGHHYISDNEKVKCHVYSAKSTLGLQKEKQ